MNVHFRSGPLALVVAGLAALALAGGPRESSKSLASGGVEITQLPFTISTCGYYYVGRCLRGKSGLDGITIVSSDVTLDLCGYTLHGITGSLSAVRLGAAVSGVTIQDGNLRNWGDHGVHADLGTSTTLLDLVAADCNKNGFRGGADALIDRCASQNAGDAGITAASGLIRRSRASGGGNDGFFLGRGVISDCVALDNDLQGIITGGACTIERCQAEQSGNEGIQAGAGSTVVDCTATANGGHGIQVGAGSTVRASTASGNGSSGIELADGSSAIGCTATGNQDGVRAASQCLVRENNCSSNSQAGVRVLASGTSSRIDENQVASNATGIQVDGTRNVILRNSASANGASYSIAAANAFGQIVNVAGAGSFVGTDPWQNFIY